LFESYVELNNLNSHNPDDSSEVPIAPL
jgi:hypothetical protein